MKRAIRAFAGAILGAAILTAPASADFGLNDPSIEFLNKNGTEARQAGSRPYAMRTTINVNTTTSGKSELPIDAAKNLITRLPAGFIGDRNATPRCSGAEFVDIIENISSCPDSSAVGMVKLRVGIEGPLEATAPVYNLEPPPGAAAKLGFVTIGDVPVTLEVGVNPDPPYNVIVRATKIAQPIRFYGAELTIWGVPASPDHDAERGSCAGSGGCKANVPPRPFVTLPRSCSGQDLITDIEVDSWQKPGAWLHYPISTPSMVGCSLLGFAPRISALPTTDQADSPTGMNIALEVDDENLTNPAPSATAHSDIKKAVVTLPEGVTANPSVAEGLGTCSAEDLATEHVDSEPGEGCPQASKIGTVRVETPILEGEIIEGELFIATQYENPFGTLLALYMVIRDPELGILVKLPGKIEPDPVTGQLVGTFGEAPYELPQFPLGRVRIQLREGGRSPLVSPATCDTYTTVAEFTPWANPGKTLSTTSSFQITRGVGGSDCPPAGAPPFDPGFTAGSVNNEAGAFSPFSMRFTRRDGDQDLTRVSAAMPRGLTAKLAGVAQCHPNAIATARGKSGRAELATPSCPENSRIGSVLGGVGVGSQLTYASGVLYMAGPFSGAPLSVVAIVPAVAGPFDVGTVVTQFGLKVDPRTAEVRVDGAASDPLPHILAGIPLRVREVRAVVDRSQFVLNPTSCERTGAIADIWGGGANPFTTADDFPVSRFQRFQAANCARLGFKPDVSLTLKGGTKRGDFPALRTVYRPRPGDANLSRMVLRLPRSAFLEQGHFRDICTRVQFAADACPGGAVYGRARAFTPLLEQPLEGPVYLRSSSNDLPDLVLDLHGLVDFEAIARIDSHKGGIRATLENLPDAPIEKVVVTMEGGRKGLIVNSRNLCIRKSRAAIQADAQNGKRHNLNPLVRATGCKKKGRPR